ncbi:MAG: hypothetical protein JWN44_4581 [Myxococcales bacterium]|nr:hypothetical protein [Myxococcales bacterium]
MENSVNEPSEKLGPRYWLGVVSRAHVELGVCGGFAQLCHGRAQPLERMRAGDWLIYYSPRTEMGAGAPLLQAFTAVGRIADERVYRFDMGDGWVPSRRDVAYETVRPLPLGEVKSRLHFTAKAGWAMQLRRGHLELDAHDFELIAGAMRVTPSAGIADPCR